MSTPPNTRQAAHDDTVTLVIGGRSKIGSELIRLLSGDGRRVRALVRASEAAASFPAGVEAVSGDLADREALSQAMDGAARVFLLCGPSEQEVALNTNAIDAARAAQVRMLVRSSIVGADPRSASTFARDHGLCDEQLAQSGLPHAIVRPNLFMQNIPESTIPSIGADGTFYANAGDARISMVDTRDVAAVAARVLTEPGHEGRTYDVMGPQALSYADVADLLSTHLERPVKYVEAADADVRATLLGFGVGEWMANALVDLYVEYRRSGADGYAAQTTDTVQKLTGTAPRTLDALLGEVRRHERRAAR